VPSSTITKITAQLHVKQRDLGIASSPLIAFRRVLTTLYGKRNLIL